MSLPRFAIVAGVALLLVSHLSGPVHALEGDTSRLPPVIGATELYASSQTTGLALAGTDPVSYFLSPSPRAGRPEYELVWRGLAWRFASAANRAAFLRDPESFLPRVGGFDATAVAQGRLVSADPGIYAVRDGHLFLFRNGRTRQSFLQQPALAKEAEARWPALVRQVVGD